MSMGPDPRRVVEVQKRLFLPSGGHVVLRDDDEPREKPRVSIIPYLDDLKRGPHMLPQVTRPTRLIAFCVTCNKTVHDLPAHVKQDDTKYVPPERHQQHEIRYMLLPDLRFELAA